VSGILFSKTVRNSIVIPAQAGTTVFPYGGPIFDGKNYSGQQCACAGATLQAGGFFV
jgi:hypothetical protein